MKAIVGFGAGLLFGLGLVLGGMMQPARIVGFLDVFGRWDPTLALVMIGALTVNVLAFRLTRRRHAPVCDRTFHLPATRKIDARLLVGAGIFGVGWALAGYCPGPALTNLATLGTSAFAFVGAMALGTAAWSRLAALAPALTARRRPEPLPQHASRS